jgi:hypothetical protein
MAVRTRSWFDAAKLLSGESLIREAPVRLRTSAPPGWWEGTLVLTSDRLFFLPSVRNPLATADIAFWLADLEEAPAGRNRLLVRNIADGRTSFTFQFMGPLLGPRGLLGERGKIWLYEIRRARRHARPAYAFDAPPASPPEQHRAAAG